MKTYARIESDTVVELFKTDGDISEMFHPDMVWVDVTAVAGIAERWKKSGSVFAPPPSVSLVDIKAGAWEAIKAKRDTVSAGGVKVGTKWYHSDESSRAKYLGLVCIADAAVAAGGASTATLQYGGQDIQWKTMDGSFIKMTVQRANDVFNAVSGLDFTAFAAAETHRVAMEASADPSAYDFANGWPATFGG